MNVEPKKEKASFDSVRRVGEKVWGFPALFKGGRRALYLMILLCVCVCWLVTDSSVNGGKLIPFS